MKKFLFYVLCVLSIGWMSQANAQYWPTEKYFQHANIPSVDAFNFIKAVDQGINPSTGTLNVSIPVYIYEDADFKIPITIDYACTGYMPNIPAGNVGHGWVLNAGGVITREVRGVPDEYRSRTEYPCYYNYGEGHNGYYIYPKDLPAGNQEYVFSLDKCIEEHMTGENIFLSGNIYLKGGKKYETTPDIFSFKFPGYSGKFNINHNKIDVYDTPCPYGELKVDLSDFSPTNSTDDR